MPRSSRQAQAPDTFDKDFVRRWVVSQCDPYKDPIPPIPEDVILQAAAIYVSAYEKITGKRFPLPDPTVPPLTRVRRTCGSISARPPDRRTASRR